MAEVIERRSDITTVTPMMRQYLEVKEEYDGYILLYRLGDFYECFFDDAMIASKELELTLTGRDCGDWLVCSRRGPCTGCLLCRHGSDHAHRLPDSGI